jgi:hypothetical protein
MSSITSLLQKQNIFFAEDTIGGVPCTIGYIKKFRWRWMATQLNTFVFFGDSEAPIDQQAIDRFSAQCFDYANRNSKGWPRGFQSAVGSIAILQGTQVQADAVTYCEKNQRKHVAAFEIAVVYDKLQKKATRFKSTPAWGMLYFSYFAKTIDQLIAEIPA